MNLLTLSYPNDTDISIIINSGENCSRYVGGGSGLITGNQTFIDGLSHREAIKTTKLTVESGAAPYVGKILLSSGNQFNGGLLKFLTQMPNSTNPTIQFVDEASNEVLLTQSGESTGFSFFSEFSSNGANWALDYWI